MASMVTKKGRGWTPPTILRSLLATLVVASTMAIGIGVAPAPVSASPHDFTDPIFSANARGDIVTIGNVTTECNPGYTNANWTAAESARACGAANDGSAMMLDWSDREREPINNGLDMEYVDVDGDGSTFSSSSANLAMPAGSTVLWAGAHWNAAANVPDPTDVLRGSTYEAAPVNNGARFNAKLKAPGGSYTALSASDTWDDTNPGGTVSYGGYVDITNTVKAAGNGTYTFADVQSCTGFGGCFGSWSITVAYANQADPARNLNVWHGWQLTSPSLNGGAQEFAVNGITPPPTGAVNAKIGVVQADGDRSLGPDSLEIASASHAAWTPFTTPLNPADDFFRSVISTGQTGNPNRVNNLNTDIALVQRDDIVSNTDTGFKFKVQTEDRESLYSQVVHAAVDIYQPEIHIDKTVSPAGPVNKGDQVTWTLKVDNVGVDPIRKAVVTDPLPAGVTFVPGSVKYTAGGPSAILGSKTDAAGDDQVDWDAAARKLTLRVGAGADGTNGGTMGIAPAGDGSDTVTITFKTTVDVTPGQSVTNTATAYGEGRELDDPYGPITTTDDDPAVIAAAPVADLGITKDDGGAVVRKVGDKFTYTLVATNAGPSPATGVVITDDLDPMIKFASSADGCTAAGQTVTCPIGNMAVNEDKTITFEVEVVTLPGAGKVIPNLASIDGNEPNPDCTDDPNALCNSDDEETPQPEVDLGIKKSDGDAVIHKVGDEFTYTLEVTNAGPDNATGVVVTDPLEERLEFVSSDEGCAADGQDVSCLIGDLAAKETKTVHFKVKALKLPDPGKTIPNVATVSGNEPQPDCDAQHPDALCDSDDEETPGPTSDLGIKKDDGGFVIHTVGDQYRYTFTVTNKGPDDEPNAVVTDVLPEHLKYVTEGSDPACTADGQKVTCKVGLLKAGETRKGSIVVEVVKLPAAGKQIHNVASIDGDNPNPDCKAPTPNALCNEDPEDTPYTPPTPPAPPGVHIPGTSATLPRTGASVLGLVAIGLTLIVAGGFFMVSRRRAGGLALARETSHPQGFDA